MIINFNEKYSYIQIREYGVHTVEMALQHCIKFQSAIDIFNTYVNQFHDLSNTEKYEIKKDFLTYVRGVENECCKQHNSKHK